MTQPIVSIKNLDVTLNQNEILKDVSIEVFAKDIAVIIGLNGAGKTTLLKAILGIIKPQNGIIDIATKKIGYVPQKFSFDRTIPVTVKEILQIYSQKSDNEILKKLTEVDAENLLNKQVGHLSGGELQRILIANALLSDPELLLLDEATAGIDVKAEENFYEIISRIHRIYDVAIIMVSHDIHTVFTKATKVFCLSNTIYCGGTPLEVSNDPVFRKMFGANLAPFIHNHDEHTH